MGLAGEWDFYWNRFLPPGAEPADPSTPGPDYIRVPGKWNGHVKDGMAIPGKGFATYRLTVIPPPGAGRLGIKILDMATSFSLYVNGRLLTTTGIPARTPEEAVPLYRPGIVEIPTVSDQYEILVHVSNFDHWQGGMWEVLLLGDPDVLRHLRQQQLIIDAVLFGMIFIMGIYHLGLYQTRRIDRSSFWFGLFCLMISVRILTHGERYLVALFPDMPYDLLLRLAYLSTYLCVPFFVLYARLIFPRDASMKIVLATVGISLLFCGLVAAAEPLVFSRSMRVYQVFILSLLVYAVVALYRAVTRQRPGSLIFLAGFLALLGTAVNDILYARLVVNTGYWVGLGLVIFIFSQAFLLSRRFSRAFTIIEEQKHDLEKSETLFKAAIENSPTAMVVSRGAEETVIAMNKRFTALFGYTMQDIPDGDAWWPLAYPDADYRAAVRQFWNEALTASDPLASDTIAAEAMITCRDGTEKQVLVNAAASGDVHFITFVDLTERKLAEAEKEQLILELRTALEEIKTLRGIVPICSSCKKIRDDKGYWTLLESYIERHSDASFSHSMCPECCEKFYGGETWFSDIKKKL